MKKALLGVRSPWFLKSRFTVLTEFRFVYRLALKFFQNRFSTVLVWRHSHPFILQPRFLQFLEIWFKKYGLRNLVREIWFEKSGWPEKKVVLYHISKFFLVQEKWLTRKKYPSLKNHFSRTTSLHFSRK